MCGFVGVFEIGRNGENLRAQVLRMSGKIRHRGPDWSGIYCGPRGDPLSRAALDRRPAVGRSTPVTAATGNWCWPSTARSTTTARSAARAGRRVRLPHRFGLRGDPPALPQDTARGCSTGSTASSPSRSTTSKRDEYLIARDPVGVIPLYIGWDADERCYVASELKALEGVCNVIRPFEPGHYRWSREGKTTRWYKRDWFEYDAVEQDDGADHADAAQGARSGRPSGS